MSGGHFNYKQSEILEIAKEIDHLIYVNGSSEKDARGVALHAAYPPDVIQKFRVASRKLKKAYIYAQRIDWLVSGDDGEGSFKVRLAEDLRKLANGV